MSKEKLDQLLGHWISKKLLVLMIATLLSIFGNLTSHDWMTIAIVYLSSQGVVDAVRQLKS